jgi:D-3-phosphoglycerate dehydrogenase / 2-oxoglutarate reductase
MTAVAVTPRSFRQTPGEHHRLLDASGLEVRYPSVDRPLTEDELIALLRGCRGAIVGLDPVSRRVLDECRPEVVVRYGAGLDTIDLSAASRARVRVANTPGANAASVAELAIGLMFALARRVTQHNDIVRQGEWRRVIGVELAGRRLGVLGLGAIGRGVAARAAALGMEVVAHDPFAETEDVRLVSFDELLETCDVVSVHVPLSDATTHLFDAAAIERMRPGSFLINTSRGGIVDEAALADALRAGHLAGAAVDCFEAEPPDPSNPLLGLDTVIALPHCGAATTEAAVRTGVLAVEELLRGLAGEPMLGEVALPAAG